MVFSCFVSLFLRHSFYQSFWIRDPTWVFLTFLPWLYFQVRSHSEVLGIGLQCKNLWGNTIKTIMSATRYSIVQNHHNLFYSFSCGWIFGNFQFGPYCLGTRVDPWQKSKEHEVGLWCCSPTLGFPLNIFLLPQCIFPLAGFILLQFNNNKICWFGLWKLLFCPSFSFREIPKDQRVLRLNGMNL